MLITRVGKNIKPFGYYDLVSIKVEILLISRGTYTITRSAIGQCPILHSCLFPFFRDLNYFSFNHLPHNALPERLYSLHQSALLGDQNDIQILGLYCFVSEEFNYNIANYISSQMNLYIGNAFFHCMDFENYLKILPKHSVRVLFKLKITSLRVIQNVVVISSANKKGCKT